jgi:hypothetical protein
MAKFTDKKEFEDWLLNSDEGRELALPVLDRKVDASIKNYQSRHPDAVQLGKHLDIIESVIAEKDAKLRTEELKHFAFRKCIESGVNADLLSGFPLTDEDTITAKIDQLSLAKQKQDADAINRAMGENAFRPGSGNSPSSEAKRKTFADFYNEAAQRDGIDSSI